MTTQTAPARSDRSLPVPVDLSSDRERALHDLDVHGYCLIANALSPAEVDELKGHLVEVAAQEVEDGTAYIYSSGSNQRVWNLLNKGDGFVELAQHPMALDLAAHVLGPVGSYQAAYYGAVAGPHVLLDAIHANIAGPGGSAQARHFDDMGVTMLENPLPFPCFVNVAWLLDDFTEDNGATRVVPGSHLTPTVTPTEDDAVSVIAPAGSALVFGGLLWHGTGANSTTDVRRHLIFTSYSRPWLRSGENHFLSVDSSVVESATPVLKRLLGYEAFLHRGTVGGFPLGTEV